MIELSEWWREIGGAERTWLVLGKGPSFETRGEYDLSEYTTLAINHVVMQMPVFAVSAVNFDVAAECAEAIYANSSYLLMPRYPHTIKGDAPELLETYFERIPALRKLSDERRLVWYNIDVDTQAPGSPAIPNGPFSVCILFNLLGEMGAKRVRTLGVDGGIAYGGSFADMAERTRLANGMPTYDLQFKAMMRAVKTYRMDFHPLNSSDKRLAFLTAWHKIRQYLRIDPLRDWRERNRCK